MLIFLFLLMAPLKLGQSDGFTFKVAMDFRIQEKSFFRGQNIWRAIYIQGFEVCPASFQSQSNKITENTYLKLYSTTLPNSNLRADDDVYLFGINEFYYKTLLLSFLSQIRGKLKFSRFKVFKICPNQTHIRINNC